MSTIGLPNLLTNSRLSAHIAEVSSDLARVSEEVTTGLFADPVGASGNNPARLTTIERNLTLIESTERSLKIAVNRAGVTQTALQSLRGTVEGFGADLLSTVENADIVTATRQSDAARDSFAAAVSALNTRFGDRALFAGAAVDQGAIAPADQILPEIQIAVAAATGSDEAIAAVDAYFAAGGGFEAGGYTGSLSGASVVELEPGARLDYAVRGDANEIRTVLRSLALAVVGNEGGFANDSDAARMNVLRESSTGALAATDQVIDLEARLGIAEERIDDAIAKTSAERSVLEQARNGIIARDPFDAAVELTAIETQLQTVFSITARLSSLNLTNFL